MMSALQTLAEQILRRTEECGLSLVTAESCTAGALAHVLSRAEGASKHLHGGFVAYTKAMKTAALGVPSDLLAAKTAVSAEVAIAMAEGALARSPSDIAVSITGVAGPDPDEDGNPVGLVFCAIATRTGLFRHARLHSKASTPDAVLDEAMRQALLLVEEACAAEPNRAD